MDSTRFPFSARGIGRQNAAPLNASAFTASTITPEAAETREPPPSLSPVVPFDDGENNGFLFDENDGQGTSD